MLLVGRGGEGVVLASQLLADTFAGAGFFVQSFPEYKAERRGAPISAFLRWDTEPIHRRYRVRECDVLADVSPSDPSPVVLDCVRPGGTVVLNRDARYPYRGDFSVARVPASKIARERGVLSSEGRPMGNAAVLGACVHLLLPDGFPQLEWAIRTRMGRLAPMNVEAARAGYERVTRQHALAGDAPAEHAPAPAPWHAPLFPISTQDSLHLHTGAWSLERPVLLEGCTACGVCALFCPEGSIARHDGAMTIDYEYCKGCGICEAVCPVKNAVAMEEAAA